jgi:hypothetical protein
LGGILVRNEDEFQRAQTTELGKVRGMVGDAQTQFSAGKENVRKE